MDICIDNATRTVSVHSYTRRGRRRLRSRGAANADGGRAKARTLSGCGLGVRLLRRDPRLPGHVVALARTGPLGDALAPILRSDRCPANQFSCDEEDTVTTRLVKGTPVISLTDGSTLGAIDHVYFDPDRLAVVGFTFHKGGLFGGGTSGLVDIADVHALVRTPSPSPMSRWCTVTSPSRPDSENCWIWRNCSNERS